MTTDSSSTAKSSPASKLILLALACLLAVGGFLRLHNLGRMDTRGDEIELLQFMQQNISPIQYWKQEVGNFKEGRQMPLPRTVTCAIVRFFGMENSLRSIRIPYGVAGLLTLPAFFLIGWRLRNRQFGLVLLLLAILNPYILYWARHAHVYAYPLLFCAWSIYFFVEMYQRLRKGLHPGIGFVIGASLCSILACYSHMSTWAAIGVLWLGALWLAWYCGGDENRKKNFAMLGAGMAAWLLVLSPFIVGFLVAMSEEKDTFITPHGNKAASVYGVWRLPFVYLWGGGFPRAIVTVGLLAMGLYVSWKNKKYRNEVSFLLTLFIVVFGALFTVMMATSGLFTFRYFLPTWFAFLLVSAWGLIGFTELINKKLQKGSAATLPILCLAMTALMAWPVKWIYTLDGAPAPYTKINNYLDTHLQRNAPVIVDRWFEPLHEMRHHAPKNVSLTFTVPNEPLEAYKNNRWRESAQQFFLKNPDAGYLELVKTYFRAPGVGYWRWPRQYFKQRAAITNEPGFKLRQRILGPTVDFYGADTNRLVAEIFYNTPEDVIQTAASMGMKAVVLYKSGWRYQKLQDYRNIRIMETQVELDVVNLTNGEIPAMLMVSGAAMGGQKKVQVVGQPLAKEFVSGALQTWELGPTLLKPGHNILTFRDDLFRLAKIPLAVLEIQLKEGDKEKFDAFMKERQALEPPQSNEAVAQAEAQTSGISADQSETQSESPVSKGANSGNP